ncbi:meiotic (sporulation) septin Spn6 [Schizosaccharomyces pombe]|uniref:Septin homolog spn6 n=1 Tax=Schizosaccharomyces pombe (strain 972 / ATCC 24843) TaxID=284812 RepID=SPN6_SCHPO|nr:putative septin Spn6 [Schizosaccharomyces pombe]Q09883.1 RecName: Full=Septin homolog spn6 [Schizosaccharomyces pombe 972h-]CAB37422.1 septin Spn6 (predicted) [Schizosaccharomyces pombe]|eukprot:NP_001342876.1 putative septin Spn6 [Schizosaccharomyces pombe]
MSLTENLQLLLNLDSLPSKRENLIKRKECGLTIMLCGASGTGKTTFFNTLFATSLQPEKSYETAKETIAKKTLEVKKNKAVIEEDGFHINLTVLDTPGFGDFIDNTSCWNTVAEYLDEQHERYLIHDQNSLRVPRKDTRVHVCLYFITPVSFGMLPLDVLAMKELSTHVNLVPVIAKADTFTTPELTQIKQKIRRILEAQSIDVFHPSTEYSDYETAELLDSSLPYAIISSVNEVCKDDGEKSQGRRYPWGTSEIYEETHCDFLKLKKLLINRHMLELINTTETNIYERYRREQLTNRKSGIPKLKKEHYERLNNEKRAIQQKITQMTNETESFFQAKEEKMIETRDALNSELSEYHERIRALETQIESLKSYKGRGHKK